MKSILFVLILLLSNAKSYSGINYLEYHRSIITAESLFLSGKESEAIAVYKKTFSQYPKNFVKDTYIAAQIACKSKDTASLKYFLTLSFRKGMEWSVVENDFNVNTVLKKNPNYKQDLFEIYQREKDVFIGSINIQLRYEITAMAMLDQLYHKVPSINRNSGYSDSLFNNVTNENIKKLSELIKKHGYPGENLIGIKNNKLDNTFTTLTDGELLECTSIFFYHQACGFQLLKEELYQSVLNGDLHPREYATIYEWSFGDILEAGDTSSTIIYQIDSTGNKIPIVLTKIDHSDDLKMCQHTDKPDRAYNTCKVFEIFNIFSEYPAEKINADRSLIGIASLEHDARKKEFAEKHQLKLFFGLYGSR